ncbi:MAG TPA: hypothetical protein VGI82_09245 [Chitinophagaceae bacterium]
MKKPVIAILAVTICVMQQGCMKDKLTHTYSVFIPVYKSKTEVYANIRSNPPQEIKSPGKLFLYNNYIFLNEVDKGVHIIDNSNPASPIEKAFINIPGNLDIAVKGNTLYADLYADLVVIDISNPLHAQFVKYIPNIFPGRIYENGFVADSSQVIVDWIRKDTTVDIQSASYPFAYTLTPGSASGDFVQNAQATPGISGSTARFTIVNDYLYTVNGYALNSFDISNATDPQEMATNTMNWNIETIYSFRDKLFIGSFNGMFIYDIANPSSPESVGQFQHVRSCDPVIADDSIAYVTLHDGTLCGGSANELDVLNISNLSSASLIKIYPMTGPHGLAKDGTQLFICDGKAGLKEFDVTHPFNPVLKTNIAGIEASDVIAWNKNLIVVATDGLYQYDYSQPGQLVQRSKLPVNSQN